jgi:cytoskeletal protein CcmA (bactofilin family)
MPEPWGQVPHPKAKAARLSQSSPSGEFADFLPDTSSYFEVWLADLHQPLHNLAPQPPAVDDEHAPSEFRFEGTLQVDGYAKGLVHSLTGTLILGEAAELESNIVVATAIINGRVLGDIHATERVELLSHARVIGNIETPALAIQPGAVFEGECHYLPSPFPSAAGDAKNEEGQQASPVDASLTELPGPATELSDVKAEAAAEEFVAVGSAS